MRTAGRSVALQVRSSITDTVPVGPEPELADIDGVGGRVDRNSVGYLPGGELGGVGASGERLALQRLRVDHRHDAGARRYVGSVGGVVCRERPGR